MMLNRRMQLGSMVALVAAVCGANFIFAQDAEVKPTAPGLHYRAKQIIGSQVGLDGNASVGTVDDIVLDENGNVDYLIVMVADKKLITVPWDAASFNVEKRVATVRITPKQFQEIPTYTVDHYPVFSAPYRTQVYKYYGLTPAQERRVIRRGTVVVPN